VIKGKGLLIFLLTGLILDLAFSPQSVRAWSTIGVPGAQTVPTAPPTPPTPTSTLPSPTETPTTGGTSYPPPDPSATAQAGQPDAAATAYPAVGFSATPPDAYPSPEAYPVLTSTAVITVTATQAVVKQTQASGVATDPAGAEPTAKPASNPQPADTAWIGYTAGGLVLAAGLIFWLLRRRNANVKK
jgi:hypothetical protein